MDDTSFIGKLLCAIVLAAALGWVIPSSIEGLLTGSAATDLQIFWVKAVAGLGSAFIGGCLGWAHAKLIITGSIFTTLANVVLGVFSI